MSTKHRRTIDVDGVSYRWWVGEDWEACGVVTLTVVSEDKAFLVKYVLAQRDELRHVTVLGRAFRDRTDCGGRWRRFRAPPFGTSDSVTPTDVAALVRWGRSGREALVEVNADGHAV